MPKYAGLRTTTVVLSMSLVALFASTAHAGPIVLQTGFEFDIVGNKNPGTVVGTGGSDIGSGFTTSGFNVSVRDNTGCVTRGLSTQCLSLLGEGSFNPTVTSVDTFAAGAYQLAFAFAGTTGLGQYTVTLGNFGHVFTGVVPAATFTFGFTLTSPAQLSFAAPGLMVDGAFDNIVLTRTDVATPVPEPATLTLLAGPLLLGALRARRRTRA